LDEKGNNKVQARRWGLWLLLVTILLSVILYLITGGYFFFFLLILPLASGGKFIMNIFKRNKTDENN